MFSKDQIKKGIEGGVIVGDGHSLLPVGFYSSFVGEEALRKAGLVETHKSDLSNHKGTIYNSKGEPMESFTGVYNLSFLYWLAHQVEVTFDDYMGRGSQAQEIVRRLVEWTEA